MSNHYVEEELMALDSIPEGVKPNYARVFNHDYHKLRIWGFFLTWRFCVNRNATSV